MSRCVYNASDLLNKMSEHHFTNTKEETAGFIINKNQNKDVATHLKIFTAIGAYIASICFISFLTISKIISFNNETELLVWGVIFITGAVFLHKLVGKEYSVKNSFITQASFAFMFLGKILAVCGLIRFIDSKWDFSLAILFVTAITYGVYRVSADRFISSFAVLVAVLINIIYIHFEMGHLKNFTQNTSLLLNVFFVFQVICVGILFTNNKIKKDYIPMAYAFLISLCFYTVLVTFLQQAIPYIGRVDNVFDIFIPNISLAVVLISLIVWLGGGIDSLKKDSIRLPVLAVIFLGFMSTPGLILAITLLIFGYFRYSKFIITLGTLLMIVFVANYYYGLDLSLMHKAGVLIGSGAFLVAGRFYMKYRNWDNGGTEICEQK